MSPSFADLLKVASIRVTLLYYISSFSSLMGTESFHPFLLLVSAFYWLLFCIGTELFNRCADARDDRFACPERSAVCAALGYGNLFGIAVMAYFFYALLSIACFVVFHSAGIVYIAFVCIFIGYNYSYGLRFKTCFCSAQLRWGSTIALPYLAGMAATGEYYFSSAHLLYPLLALTYGVVLQMSKQPCTEYYGYRKRLTFLLLPVVLILMWQVLIGAPRFLLLLPLIVCLSRLHHCLLKALAGASDALLKREVTETALLMVVASAFLIELATVQAAFHLFLSLLLWCACSCSLHWYQPDYRRLTGLLRLAVSGRS